MYVALFSTTTKIQVVHSMFKLILFCPHIFNFIFWCLTLYWVLILAIPLIIVDDMDVKCYLRSKQCCFCSEPYLRHISILFINLYNSFLKIKFFFSSLSLSNPSMEHLAVLPSLDVAAQKVPNSVLQMPIWELLWNS